MVSQTPRRRGQRGAEGDTERRVLWLVLLRGGMIYKTEVAKFLVLSPRSRALNRALDALKARREATVTGPRVTHGGVIIATEELIGNIDGDGVLRLVRSKSPRNLEEFLRVVDDCERLGWCGGVHLTGVRDRRGDDEGGG